MEQHEIWLVAPPLVKCRRLLFDRTGLRGLRPHADMKDLVCLKNDPAIPVTRLGISHEEQKVMKLLAMVEPLGGQDGGEVFVVELGEGRTEGLVECRAADGLENGNYKQIKMYNSINILKLTIDDKMFKVK